ncbi:phage baseplate assembly protein V [Kovacikia minuta CCNUW1]|uniref:phage baseplate assembly protein V n=1 Tax=Kovacikia minuta TaxID=2931930 RepID=UPI001CC9BA0B|nr:phage baseplate assembly protein V [Kovacikia minuta]UBF28589.1 phage baseplate assembly protein V [Kovacikia minuta CCNUW1]
MPQFLGKYRGKVATNKDPLNLGRIQVEVPAIYGSGQANWAMPCSPYAGKNIGFFAIPPIGSNIWVEFEAGDPNYPIWVGCFWGEDQLPEAAKVEEPEKIQMFKADGFTAIVSNVGENKGLTIEVETPIVERKLKLVFNADGIEINNKDETTIKIKADIIELKNKENSTITISADTIQHKESNVEMKFTSGEIDLNCNPATLKLSTSSGIELANSSATAKLSTSGIELTSTPTTIKLTPAQIELTNTAATIKLSPVSVNVNNGALEVI